MGILKKEKKEKTSSLLSDIRTSAEWIVRAMNSSGYNVGMTIDSLREIDRFFNEHMNDDTHSPNTGGLLSENMGSRLFGVGSLIGEVIIHECGGEWITNDNDEQGEINIAVKLPDGSVIWPVQRVMNRCREGPENDVYNYVMLAVGRYKSRFA